MTDEDLPTGDDREDDPFGPAEWDVPWHARLPGILLGAALTAAWLIAFPSGGMMRWGLSGATLAQGRFEGIALHLFAHGPPFHILMNVAVLVAISGPLVARLGNPPGSWARFAALFVLSGLAGAALYLLIHPHGDVPMLGASGAIYGLLGLLLRLPPQGEALMPMRSARMRRAMVRLIRENLIFVVLLALLALSAGRAGGLAWEAHLGGLLFGLFGGPLLLPRSRLADPL